MVENKRNVSCVKRGWPEKVRLYRLWLYCQDLTGEDEVGHYEYLLSENPGLAQLDIKAVEAHLEECSACAAEVREGLEGTSKYWVKLPSKNGIPANLFIPPPKFSALRHPNPDFDLCTYWPEFTLKSALEECGRLSEKEILQFHADCEQHFQECLLCARAYQRMMAVRTQGIA